MHRREFLKTAAATVLASKLNAEEATKHYVAYSMATAGDVVRKAVARGVDFRVKEAVTYFLGGITKPFVFLCGNADSDWILIGEREAKIPALTLDDLVVAIRAGFIYTDHFPGVTIDPRGGGDGATIQDVRFFGGVEGTAFGQTCFDADLLMKKVGMNLEVLPIDGLTTYFDLATKEARESGTLTEIMSRFWYAPSLNMSHVVDGVVLLKYFHSGISTEVMSARVGGDKVENLAAFYSRPSSEFARSFENHYPQISIERPVFARLEALAKLSGLTAALRGVPPIQDFSYWRTEYPVAFVKTPTEQAILEQEKEEDGLQMRVRGGVRMQSIVADLSNGNTAAFRKLVLAARQGSESIWEFDLELSDGIPKGVSYLQGPTGVTTFLSMWTQAQFLISQERYDAAIAILDNIISDEPTLQDPYNLRGFALSSNGSGEKALEDFDKAIRINPHYSEAYFNRGNTNRSLLRYPDAIRDFSLAITNNPSMAEAFVNRGNLHALLGDSAAALVDYEKALSLNPRFAVAYFDRGLLKNQKGDHSAALGDFDQAIKFDSHLAKAYFEKGSLLEAEGSDEGALNCYERFLMYDLPDEDGKRYSKDAVRGRLDDLKEDVAMGTAYMDTHNKTPLPERLKKIRERNGFRTSEAGVH
jgi:tetratricopeptide (TPR) repeat protein